jgi:DNA repair ATPase RecN
MSALDKLRSFAESREADCVPIRDGLTYGDARESIDEFKWLRKSLSNAESARQQGWDEANALRAEVDKLKEFQLAKEKTVQGLEEENDRITRERDEAENLMKFMRKHDEDCDVIASLGEKVERLKEGARLAYECLLGDTDYSAWHSQHCYQRIVKMGDEAACVCGLTEARAILRGLLDAALAEERKA